jgi:hypothetical protein
MRRDGTTAAMSPARNASRLDTTTADVGSCLEPTGQPSQDGLVLLNTLIGIGRSIGVNKSLCSAVLILGLSCEPPGPSYSIKEPKADDLVGTWRLTYGHVSTDWIGQPLPLRGVEVFTLLKDGTYSQSFTDSGEQFEPSGNKWKLEKDPDGRWTVDLHHFRSLRAIGASPPMEWEIQSMIVYEDRHDWVLAYQGPQEEPMFHRAPPRAGK